MELKLTGSRRPGRRPVRRRALKELAERRWRRLFDPNVNLPDAPRKAAPIPTHTNGDHGSPWVPRESKAENGAGAQADNGAGAPPGDGAAELPDGQLDLNSADFEQLRALGMSVTQAKRVIAQREQRDRFSSLDDLDAIPGFPEAFRAELKQRLTV